MIGSGTPHFTGIVEFHNSDGTRNGYVGFNPEGGAMQYGSDTGQGHAFSGGPVAVGDANFELDYNGGSQPLLRFDSGDYLQFTRTNNTLSFNVGGTSLTTIDGSGNLSSTGAIFPGGDANYLLDVFSSNPRIQFDTNDNIAYDRAGNVYNFNIAGSTRLSLANAVLTMAGDVLATGDVVAGNDTNFRLKLASGNPQLILDSGDALIFNRTTNTHSLTLANSTQLSVNAAGTFVANVLTVGDGNFGMSLNGGGQPISFFDSGDFLGYVRSSNIFNFVIGSATKATIDSSGNLVAYGAVLASGDTNFGLSIPVANTPRLTFDTGGDQIIYDRTANKYYFVIGGVNVASIDASGNMRLKGTLTQSVTP